MPKSKKRKNHKKKVDARNKKISDQKRRMEKAKEKFIMDMIKREQEKGAFENTDTIDPIGASGPDISLDDQEGPSL